jgi:hypothetical protein
MYFVPRTHRHTIYLETKILVALPVGTVPHGPYQFAPVPDGYTGNSRTGPVRLVPVDPPGTTSTGGPARYGYTRVHRYGSYQPGTARTGGPVRFGTRSTDTRYAPYWYRIRYRIDTGSGSVPDPVPDLTRRKFQSRFFVLLLQSSRPYRCLRSTRMLRETTTTTRKSNNRNNNRNRR